MKLKLFLSNSIFLLLAATAYPYSQGYVELNSIENQIRFVDFDIGPHRIDADLGFSLKKQNGLLTLKLKGQDVIMGDKNLNSFDAEITQSGSVILLNRLAFDHFTVSGRLDLGKNNMALNIQGSWIENSEDMNGQIELKAKVWGKIGDFLTSGQLIMRNGTHEGTEFSYLRLDFLGKPPVLSITDSEIILLDGTVVEVDSVLNLRDFSNLLPDAVFKPQKVFLSGWELFSEDKKGVGLKKTIGEKFNLSLDSNGDRAGTSGPGTELRYSLQKNNFLKMKMNDSGNILGFERRKEF